MEIVTANHICSVLEAWAEGSMSEADVHAWAEDRYAVSTYEPETDGVNEVLAKLDQMNMNLLMRYDVPLLREALMAQNPQDLFDKIYVEVPVAERKMLLRNNSFYRAFCQ
jgi:hypothetical protein